MIKLFKYQKDESKKNSILLYPVSFMTTFHIIAQTEK